MRIRSRNLIVFSAAVLLFSTSLAAQGIGDRNRAADGDGRYSIQGRVYLPSGKPAINAKVSINSADALAISSVTDLNGTFQVGSLRAGNYMVVVSVDGFPSEKETVTIDRFAPVGRTYSLVIHLQPEGRPSKAAGSDQRSGSALAFFEKGSAYLKQNELDKALESFVKAVSIDQDYFEAKYSIGYTQYLKKNYEVASAIFVDILKQKRDFAEAYMYLGISLYYLQNIRDAETALKAAVAGKDDARVALAHRFLGGLYAQTKRHAEAAAELGKYLELVPTAPDADRLKATIEDLKKRS